MSKRYPGGFLTGDEPTVNQTEADGIWTLDQQAAYQSQNQWPPNKNFIQRSLRFNSADSAYLSWTPAQAGNRKTWTWSAWVKRSALDPGELNYVFMAGASGNETVLTFSSNDAGVGVDDSLSFYHYSGGFVWQKTTSQLCSCQQQI